MKRLYLLAFTALLMLTSLRADQPTKPPDGNPFPCCGPYCGGRECCIRDCGYYRNNHVFEQNERMSAFWMRYQEQFSH